jgi:Tfp pilus assembly protein PilF
LKQTPQNKSVIEHHAFRELWPKHPPSPQSPEQYAHVREEAIRALTVSSNCRYAHMILAQTEFRTGQWKAAAEAFRTLLAIPNIEPNAAILRDYGYALYCSGALADADRILARVAKQEHTETRTFALHLRHLIAVEQGENAAATTPASQQ